MLILATTENNLFGGVLGTAYRDAGGSPFGAVVVLPEKAERSYPVWARGYVALKLFGVRGTARLGRLQGLRLLTRAERKLGIGRSWLDSISDHRTMRLNVESINSKETIRTLSELEPDLVVSVGAPQIFNKRVLSLPRIGCINVHNGRFPKYRGVFGTFWEMYSGEPAGYVSIHEMVRKVDAGRLLAEAAVQLDSVQGFLGLMLEKKRQGGILLARVVERALEQGELLGDETVPVMRDRSPEHYFGWPSLADIHRFSWPGRR